MPVLTRRSGAQLLLVMLVPAALWWWAVGARRVEAVGAAPGRQAAAIAVPAATAGPAAAPVPGRLPGIVPPSLELSTPAERQAMVDAEVERSAASAPVAAFKGVDGRLHAFAYAQSATQASAQRDDDARRDALLEAMRADPAGFATRHGLRQRDVERMLDGSLEIPGQLLD